MDKRVNKKTGEELQQYLVWRRRGGKVPSKKGKGSYNRKDFKKGGWRRNESLSYYLDRLD